MTPQRIALMAVLLALQACDAFTTRGALRHGAVEANALVGILGLWQAKLAAQAGSRCNSRVAVLALPAVLAAVAGGRLLRSRGGELEKPAPPRKEGETR